jgi:Tol biopolymer transport system component
MKPAIRFLLAALLCTALPTGFSANQAKDDRAEVALQAAIKTETIDGDLKGAIAQYQKIAQSPNRAVAAKALVRMGQCYEKLGETQLKDARATYERVVRDFGDQAEVVAQARARLVSLAGAAGSSTRGPLTRRVLADASAIGGGGTGVVTADGKYIRSVDWKKGDVVQFEIATGLASRIANKGAWGDGDQAYGESVFSRDGKQFVYVAETEDPDSELRIRSADGSALRTLPKEKGIYASPFDWSPDGASILASREQQRQAATLALISTADGSVRVLKTHTSNRSTVQSARFSPDGRYVAFSAVSEKGPEQIDIFVMTTDGRNEMVVAGHPAEDQLLRWTPDGRGLLFLSDRSGAWDVWLARLRGGKPQGEPELLKKDFGFHPWEVLGLSPEGVLYYTTETSSGALYGCEIDPDTGKLLTAPALMPTRYTGPPSQPTWSPDGKRLAYISRRDSIGPGKNILTIRSADTAVERFLSPRLRFVNQISWAPDGRSIVALGITEREIGIVRIDADTSAVTKLAGEGIAPRLCADGKTLVYLKTGTGPGPTITRRNIETGDESAIVDILGMYYAVSPDCREVAFQKDGVISAISINGGASREIYRGPSRPFYYYSLGWMRDGKYIVARPRGGNGEKMLIPVDGGTPQTRTLDPALPKMAGSATHPDNRHMVFTVDGGTKVELWVLENFLPPPKTAKQ